MGDKTTSIARAARRGSTMVTQLGPLRGALLLLGGLVAAMALGVGWWQLQEARKEALHQFQRQQTFVNQHAAWGVESYVAHVTAHLFSSGIQNFREPDATSCQDVASAYEAIEVLGEVLALGFYGPDGRLQCADSPHGFPLLPSIADRPFWPELVSTRQQVITSPHLSPQGLPVVAVHVPITDAGVLRGDMMAILNLSWIEELFISPLEGVRQSPVWVVDDRATEVVMVAQDGLASVREKLSPTVEDGDLTALLENPPAETHGAAFQLPAWFALGEGKGNGLDTYLASVTAIDLGVARWRLITVVPEEAVVAISGQRLWSTLVLVSLSLGTVFVGGSLALAWTEANRRARASRSQIEEMERLAADRDAEHQRVVALLEADRRKDAFVYVASHELRTPMTGIMGFSELLLHRQNVPEPTRRAWLENVYQGSQRISAIVDDMLDVSRIQSGKLILNLEYLSVQDVSEQVLATIKLTTDKHEFLLDVPPGMPRVEADRDKLGQVLLNLIDNAVKYSPQGGRITVRVAHEPGQERVVMSISDQGIGIAPRDRESLFTTFHRIRRPETERVKGTGLGLYIVKGLVDLWQGEVWVKSELHRGSTFFFSLPLRREEVTQKVGHALHAKEGTCQGNGVAG